MASGCGRRGAGARGDRVPPRSGTAAGLPSAWAHGTPEADGGIPVGHTLSGELLADPDRPVRLTLRLRCPGGPAAARRLGLWVNGVAVRLDLSALPGAEADAWEATAAIPPALLRRGGITSAWDLTGPGHDGAGGGTVRLLSIEALEPQEAPAALPLLAEAAVPAEAAAASAAEEEAGAPQPVLTPAFATEARLEAPLAVAPAVQAEPPLVIAVAAPPPVIRWDLSRGFGVPEGPFPEFGLSGPIRWITARSAALVIEASEPRTAPLRLRYRSAIRDQRATVMVNGASAGELAFDGAGRLDEPREAALDLDLRAGPNVVALGFSGAVEEPGSGRELVLLVEEAGLG